MWRFGIHCTVNIFTDFFIFHLIIGGFFQCEYETPLIENIPAVYNSPCMCYPLYNILLNKILLLGKWVCFP